MNKLTLLSLFLLSSMAQAQTLVEEASVIETNSQVGVTLTIHWEESGSATDLAKAIRSEFATKTVEILGFDRLSKQWPDLLKNIETYVTNIQKTIDEITFDDVSKATTGAYVVTVVNNKRSETIFMMVNENTLDAYAMDIRKPKTVILIAERNGRRIQIPFKH